MIEPENPIEMAKELINLHQDPLTLTSLSQNGQMAATDFDRKNLAQDMLSVLKSIVRN